MSLSIILISPLYTLKVCNKVSLEPLLVQTKSPQFSQPFLIGEVLQSPDYFCVPPWDPLKQVHVLLFLGTPELNTIFQVETHESGVERKNHLPQPTGHTSFFAAQDTIGLLG